MLKLSNLNIQGTFYDYKEGGKMELSARKFLNLISSFIFEHNFFEYICIKKVLQRFSFANNHRI